MSKLLVHGDIVNIIDGAHFSLRMQTSTCYISGIAVNKNVEVRGALNEANVAVIDATISYLQSKGMLKEPIAIDYKQTLVEPIDD